MNYEKILRLPLILRRKSSCKNQLDFPSQMQKKIVSQIKNIVTSCDKYVMP